VNVQIRIGLNSGEVVVRAIGSDLHMDYTAVGQTTHLAARLKQFASPGSILVTATTLDLVEGYVAVTPLGPVPVKGLADPGAGPPRRLGWASRVCVRAVGAPLRGRGPPGGGARRPGDDGQRQPYAFRGLPR